MRVLPDSHDDNPLKQYFEQNDGWVIHKWHHYFDVYHNHFQRFRGRPVRLLEIGVNRGGSLQMWKHYFGPDAQIFGLDVAPRCKELEEEQVQIFIGDQGNRRFLRNLKDEIGSVDILIDDGGHTMDQQIVTLEVLYDLVADDGVYLVEDLHTSYWTQFSGNATTSFVERCKGLIDALNGWHQRMPHEGPSHFTRTATGVHFYDSVMVIEKCPVPRKPRATRTGRDPFPPAGPSTSAGG